MYCDYLRRLLSDFQRACDDESLYLSEFSRAETFAFRSPDGKRVSLRLRAPTKDIYFSLIYIEINSKM